MADPFKIAVLISGGGTTLRNLIECYRRDQLNAEIVRVISSSPGAGGNEIARNHDIALSVLSRSNYDSISEYSDAVFDSCRSSGADLVVMGGFLKRVKIPDDFENRVINIHPALIPAFSGKGFYGLKVHAAVIEHGCKVSGCTVHFVDDQYDHGPIIAQRAVPVEDNDTPETLQQRVFSEECRLYPEVINWIASQRLSINNRIVSLA